MSFLKKLFGKSEEPQFNLIRYNEALKDITDRFDRDVATGRNQTGILSVRDGSMALPNQATKDRFLSDVQFHVGGSYAVNWLPGESSWQGLSLKFEKIEPPTAA